MCLVRKRLLALQLIAKDIPALASAALDSESVSRLIVTLVEEEPYRQLVGPHRRRCELHGKSLQLGIAGLPHPRIAPGRPFSFARPYSWHPAGRWLRGRVRRDRRHRRSATATARTTARRGETPSARLLPARRNDSRRNCRGSGKSRGSPRRSAGYPLHVTRFAALEVDVWSHVRFPANHFSSCRHSRRNTRTRMDDGRGHAGIRSRLWTIMLVVNLA